MTKIGDINKILKKTDFIWEVIRNESVMTVDELFDKRWSEFYYSERSLRVSSHSKLSLINKVFIKSCKKKILHLKVVFFFIHKSLTAIIILKYGKKNQIKV